MSTVEGGGRASITSVWCSPRRAAGRQPSIQAVRHALTKHSGSQVVDG